MRQMRIYSVPPARTAAYQQFLPNPEGPLVPDLGYAYMAVVADRLSLRWYLGYDLDEPWHRRLRYGLRRPPTPR